MPKLSAWLHFFDAVGPASRDAIAAVLQYPDITIAPRGADDCGLGIAVFDCCDERVLDDLRDLTRDGLVLAISLARPALSAGEMWAVLHAGAADLLLWPELPADAGQVVCRLERWSTAAGIAGSARVRDCLVGDSPKWRALVARVVELAAFTTAPVLITGESGTGKELIARLIHDLDPRPDKGEFVVLDCTTVGPELSGSEFFGHERGAYTGAINAREGAFSLAHNGTLFLDEIGELGLPLQAQLLRVIQEHQFKRVGSNLWQRTDFRLVCATNRDLDAMVAEGSFRGDLFYRIAGCRCRTPALRERKADIVPLARHFLRQQDPCGEPPELDPAVREYLLSRDYPGNVRDLRQAVMRIWYRHVGPGPVTIGDLPPDERPPAGAARRMWPDASFEGGIRHAVELGVGLKEIAQVAGDLAMDVAIAQEGGNVQRAASRLGVTDRALQLRRASRRASA